MIRQILYLLMVSLTITACKKEDKSPITIPSQFTIVDNPDQDQKAFSKFSKMINVFGIKLYIEKGFENDKAIYIANILAELLDNDEDGVIDNPEVYQKLLENKACMPLVMKEKSSALKTLNKHYKGIGIADILMNDEVFPKTGTTAKKEDVAVHELLHLIHLVGYAYTYPEWDDKETSSQIRLAMNSDIANGYYNPLKHYSDNPEIQCKEYSMWVQTTIMGCYQNPTPLFIQENEWTLLTVDQIQSSAAYSFVTNNLYKCALIKPDGIYL
jgi:hypothetical protein